MDRIKVMVNGMPGNMASNIAKHVLNDDRFELIPLSLTGPEILEKEYNIASVCISLINPEQRNEAIKTLKKKENNFISVDYTHPLAVNSNAEFFCNNFLPFVMGTTGGDRKKLEDAIISSGICAVIAPNMAKQIVGFQAMMEYASKTFPDLFNGYTLTIKESHQKGKADTSGTARAMIGYFNKLGIPFNDYQIIMERDPENQKEIWGIPEEFIKGHGWHTYTLVSGDKTVKFEFTHNINGRDVYVAGTLDAIVYLNNRINEGAKGKIFSMIDVLKGI
ncbi:dihydrodipicolinate reductase [Desulfobacterium sp. N47]|uniref:4-hydroxy-tetrahydrodipicolinate reductase n=1 Tax=uncultured Desulfobacterium sp. TaxID=201089 RepID=E1YKY6_9BACT|nr:Dihydrodipicolinate reductase 2, chloroplastic [uncultured Desulfobacterium sp.]